MNLKTIDLILKKLGHHTILACNGLEAVEQWRRESIDLVLMDIQMPVMGGLEALRIIRSEESPDGRHTPLIALTAHALKGAEDQLLSEGFDGYLTKPTKMNEIQEALKQAR